MVPIDSNHVTNSQSKETKSNVRDKVTSLLKYVTRNAWIIFANDIILCLKTKIITDNEENIYEYLQITDHED